MFMPKRRSRLSCPDPLLAENKSPKLERNYCVWEEDSDGIWNSDCGQVWNFEEGGPKENGCKFCSKCGKQLEALSFVDEVKS